MNNTNNQTQNQNPTKANSKTANAAALRDKATGQFSTNKKSKGLRAKAPSPAPTQPADLLKMGLDMGLKKYAVCRQIDGSLADCPRVFKPSDFKGWLLTQKQLAR